jgi:alkylation response protein AidB-like acyl-CoA dehydrogenase
LWTSNADKAHFIVVLCRTSPPTDDRHTGLSQLIVDLRADGVEVRPVELLSGESHFAEVLFDDVFVPQEMAVGEIGRGWQQVMSELAFERSGPERVLSTFPLLAELAAVAGSDRSRLSTLGRRVAHLEALRRMSLSVGGALEAGADPSVQAAVVKEAGTRQEQEIVESCRMLAAEPRLRGGTPIEELLAQAVLATPGFTLRGGTNEILRGIVARGLGLR